MSAPESTGFLPIGTRIGEYEITAILGQGGFGITYKAWDHTLACDVAIKEYFPKHLASRDSDTISIKTTISTDAEAYQLGLVSFVKEAQILAKFQHSAIVPVKRLVQANQSAYMIMGFVDGHSLSEYLSKHNNTVDSNTLIEWAKQLLDGLREIHGEGLLHRDIKPGNVYIKTNGQAMLLDFGAARQAVGEASMTVTGLISGGYSPIEQYSERTTNQGPWSDIYSLSATLYRCVTGKKPAASPDRQDSLNDDEGDLIESLTVQSYRAYPEGLLKAINKGLEIRRKRRLQSVEAFEALLNSAPESQAANPNTAPVNVKAPSNKHPDAVAQSAHVEKQKVNKQDSQPSVSKSSSLSDKALSDSKASSKLNYVLGAIAAIILIGGITGYSAGWLDMTRARGDTDIVVVTPSNGGAEESARRNVTINITPANGYQLAMIDGTRIDTSRPVQLADGSYELEVLGQNNYADLNRRFSVSASQTRVNVELDLSSARLTIATNVPGARIVLPDQPASVTYYEGIELPKTTHRIRIVANGYKSLTTSVDLSRQSRYDFELTPNGPIAASFGIELVNIPAGSFPMGSDRSNAYDSEKPVHTVNVPAFKMMTTEVTWNHYQPCIDAGVCTNPNDKGWGRGDRPVINVSWNDVQTYISWLSRETAQSWRLPSEAEWEYAARAGSTSDYSWGDSINCTQARYGSYESECSAVDRTVSVASYSPNPWGLYDMHGNVWEWTQDCWNDSYQGAPSNGRAWTSGNCDRRVFRGGSWVDYDWLLRSSYRSRINPSNRYTNYGFRLVQGQ